MFNFLKPAPFPTQNEFFVLLSRNIYAESYYTQGHFVNIKFVRNTEEYNDKSIFKGLFYEKLLNKEFSIVKKCLTNHALIYARGIMYFRRKMH